MVIQLPIVKQLEYFLEHHGLDDSVTEVDANYRSDVNSGGCYRKLREEGKIDERTITLQVNADGARFFKVSKFGFWPFMALVNEANMDGVGLSSFSSQFGLETKNPREVYSWMVL